MKIYFVQVRRTVRALYWLACSIVVILAMMSFFGNVTIYGSFHRTLDYRPPSSRESVTLDLGYWPGVYYSEVSWPAFPWGHVAQPTSYPVSQPEHHTSYTLLEQNNLYKERTSVGTFVERLRIPRQHVVVYPNGHRNIIEFISIRAPDGRPVQWHDEFRIDAVEAFGGTVTLSGVLAIVSLLCALFGVVIGLGLGDDVANHLSIVRTRPVGKTAFVATAIGIDVMLLTLGVASIGLLLVSVPVFAYPFKGIEPGQVSGLKIVSVCLLWSITLACYGVTLALTTAARRVTAVVVLGVIVVVELMIGSSIGYGLPRPLDWIKPALDGLNPFRHYAIVFSNLFVPSIGTADTADSTPYNLEALIGLAVAGMLVAILRWRAARI
ncbi:MAG TPA: hypothetical protein VFO25_09560 [Candidatus Eremiobacteraceae bacterium]|nr:hypothetical protein [Candidatus Eremiobacteraceae bacterium]